MPGSVHVLVDGVEPTAAALLPFALFNEGHYTAMQVRGGGVRGLDLHLQRLAQAHFELFSTTLDTERVQAAIRAAVTHRPDAYLRATVIEPVAGETHVLTVTRDPLEPGTIPLRLTTAQWTRALAHIKHVGTFPQAHLARLAASDGFDDVTLIDADGRIAETTIANLAFVDEQQVVWPNGPSLKGISWSALERELPRRGYTSTTAPVRLDDLLQFRAAVVVNSIGVVPVGSIGSVAFDASVDAASRLGAIYRSIPFDLI